MSRCDRHAIAGDFVFDGAVTHRNGDVVIEKVSNRCAHGAQPSGRCFFHNEPRVDIDCSPSRFFHYQHGTTMISATHGRHAPNLHRMESV
jgi:hypothetical protein